jgi:PAS domain S-box-containing protein
LSSLRILLVDDDEAVRRGLRSLLSSRTDWLVCGEAADGLDAVEKAKTLLPSLVLMDISMPRMNGLDATRIIRRELPKSKVVIISQNDPAIVRRLAREVDAAAYVAKTNLARDLLPTIDSLNGFVLDGGKGVTESTVPQKDDAADISIPDGAVSLESILCTEELHRRPSRPPDHEKENRALVALAHALADSPRTILQTLADTILEVSQADSAGISLLTTDDGGKRFYWPAIAGKWRPHVGGGTPRDFGPCGDVLDRNTPLLFQHVERRYTYFQPVTPLVEEALLVPFYVGGKAVGTIWAVAHDDRRKFDAEDERIMSSLGTFASSAYQVLESLDALKSQMTERENAERTTGLLAAIVDSSDDAIISKRLDGVITSWNTSAEWLFGYTAKEAIGQNITLIIPPDRHDEETMILERLKRGERVEHFETVRVRKNGTKLDISLTISPVKDAAGRVIGASKVARDITERKRADRALLESEERLRTLADGLETQVSVGTQELELRNAEVLQQSEQLRELSNRLLQIQDHERRRIARELHDSAGQILTALGLSLASASQPATQNPLLAKAVEDSQKLVQQLSQEIRTMSYLLHPPLLDESGLSEAIRWYMQGLAERSGLNIELSISENFGRLPGEMELAVFRIVQECLTNIHRHSGSKTATIRLSRIAESVSLEIQDEGKGIPAEKLAGIQAQHSGVGITGMRERVRHLKGAMSIQSNGRGTKISVTLPIPTTAALEPENILQQTRAAG